MHKPKVFLDSSVIIAAILSSQGGSFYILNQLKDMCIFQTNEYVFLEIQEILRTKFIKHPLLTNYFLVLLGTAGVVMLPNPPKSNVLRAHESISLNDAPILAAALLSSDYLLTLDNEFFNHRVSSFVAKNNLIISKPKEFIEKMREL